MYKQDHKVVMVIKMKCLCSLEDVCICQFKLSLKQDKIDTLKHPLTQLIQLHNGACYVLFTRSPKKKSCLNLDFECTISMLFKF